ncbi:DUF4145 domain-containing protein [Geoanaerobacter pelophilus]|uniref:DUF4145 domain-containing protein n=1 Tax=Geoanaerobacter pelophilus TaxID=60036 RepID=UPI0013563A80|nr:DUF4145 domain-containing protein [Geoanaerobacter pelophilus]
MAFVERVGFRFWICAGCDSGTLEEYYVFDITYNDFASPVDSQYYPERKELHVEDKKFKQLPEKLNNIYRETLKAYNNKLSVLCALGIRSLIEGICANKSVAGRDLQGKINNMVSISLPQNIANNLHSLRFIGNEAAHELTAPTLYELKLAIEICEDLLNFFYELDYKAHKLTSSRTLSNRNVGELSGL